MDLMNDIYNKPTKNICPIQKDRDDKINKLGI
jgi:hypothetical protein